MSRRQYGRKRRSTWGPALMASGLAVLALVGGGLLLHATGAINIPFLNDDTPPPAQAPDRTGQIQVPISAREVVAYSQVQREHLFLPQTMQLASVWMNKDTVPANALTNPREILGRVMRRDKTGGQLFLKEEFFPVGTRPGPTAGIPPGQRAMRLRVGDVPGLHGLRQGDHFDIVVTSEVAIEEPRNRRGDAQGELDVEGPYAALHAASMLPPPEAPKVKRRRAEVRLVVEDGTIVQPVHRRQEIGTKSSLFKGSSITAKPIEEIVIAVDPSEVSALNQALAIGAKIQVAMRSGRALGEDEAVDDSRIPDLSVEIRELMAEAAPDDGAPKASRVRLVEVIDGGTKRIHAVPIGMPAGVSVTPKPLAPPSHGTDAP